MTVGEQQSAYSRSIAYLQGRGVPEDLERSFQLNAVAARAGHRDAVLAMGWYYLGGVGVAQCYEKARKWYRQSARHGEPMAMFSLGRIAYTQKDYADSLLWFRRAADHGHSRSLFWIGRHHWYGQAVARDRREALRFFHMAADRGVLAATRVLKFLSRQGRNLAEPSAAGNCGLRPRSNPDRSARGA